MSSNEQNYQYKQLFVESVSVENSIKSETEQDLKNMLRDIKQLNEINNELSSLLQCQTEQLETLDTTHENILETTETTNEILENVVLKRIKFIPIIIGGVLGAGIIGPGALLLGIKGTAAGIVAGGGGVLGGIGSKMLS